MAHIAHAVAVLSDVLDAVQCSSVTQSNFKQMTFVGR